MTIDTLFATNSIMTNHSNILTMLKLIDRSIAAVHSDSSARVKSTTTTADLQTAKIIDKLVKDARDARETYYVGVSPYIVAYRLLCQSNCNDSQAEDSIRTAYTEFIGEKNVVGLIDRCIETINTLIRVSISNVVLDEKSNISEIQVPPADKTHVSKLSELSPALDRVGEYKISLVIESMSTGDCDCGGEFVMYAESNERKCNLCGMTATIYDNAIDDANIFAQEVQRTKQNRHHPIQHCKTWIGRIQAWVGPNVPDSVYTQLRVCFTRDSTNLKNLTCRRIRKYLKEKKLTAFNNFVPFIRKVLTGISPPQLTSAELDRLYETFMQVAKVLQDMRPDNNINYYPVFIFKILDEQLSLGARKVAILECIHLQSEKTVKEIDTLYAQICARMGRAEKPKAINWGEYKKLL